MDTGFQKCFFRENLFVLTWMLLIHRVSLGLTYKETGPTITPFPKAYAIVSDNLTLTCSFLPPMHRLTWISNNTLYYQIRNDCSYVGSLYNTSIYSHHCISVNQFAWTIFHVSEKNHGETWACMTYNETGTATYSQETVIFVAVPVTAVNITSPEVASVIVTENESTEFTCVTSIERPRSNIRWYFSTSNNPLPGAKTKPTENGTLASTTSSFIYRFKKNENGVELYCTAANIDINKPVNSTNRKKIIVRRSPTPKDGYHEILFARLSDLSSMRVSVLGYPEPAEYTWYKKTSGMWRRLSPMSNILFGIGVFYANVTIVNVTSTDYADYAVKASNGIDDDSLFTKTFSVYKQGEPEIPSAFKCYLSSARDNAVIVEWTPGQNGGFRQTFVIQYRTERSNLWKENLVVEQAKQNITMKVVLENLLTDSIYIVHMHSLNIVGNSSFTADRIVRTPGNPGYNGPLEETCLSVGAIAGGIVGGLTLGSLLSMAIILACHYFKNARGKSKSTSKSTTKKEEMTEVYYNVCEEQHEENKKDNRRNVESGPEANQYEALKERTVELHYEQIQH